MLCVHNNNIEVQHILHSVMYSVTFPAIQLYVVLIYYDEDYFEGSTFLRLGCRTLTSKTLPILDRLARAEGAIVPSGAAAVVV